MNHNSFTAEPGAHWTDPQDRDAEAYPEPDEQPDPSFADYPLIPAYMHDAILGYVLHHHHVGHFLTCLLENDLRGAVTSADTANLDALLSWVRWLNWEAPARCWGSPERVDAWRDTDHAAEWDQMRASRDITESETE